MKPILAGLLLVAFAPSARAADDAWCERACEAPDAGSVIGECLRGCPKLAPARRQAILKGAATALHGKDRKAVLEGLFWAALAEDPTLRQAIGALLVAEKVLSKESATQLAGAAEVLRHAKELLAKKKELGLSPAQLAALEDQTFRVEGEDAPGTLRLSARARVGCDHCVASYLNLALTRRPAGWAIVAAAIRRIDDGSCGCCQQVQ